MDFIAILLLNFSIEAGMILNDFDGRDFQHTPYMQETVYLTVDDTPFTFYGRGRQENGMNYTDEYMQLKNTQNTISAGFLINAEELEIGIEHSINADNNEIQQTKVYMNIDTRK